MYHQSVRSQNIQTTNSCNHQSPITNTEAERGFTISIIRRGTTIPHTIPCAILIAVNYARITPIKPPPQSKYPTVLPRLFTLQCFTGIYSSVTPRGMLQVADALIMCQDCATSEHVFCASNRPRTVWRHMHILSRNYMHTTLHCGQCYRLLLRARRAIDCYTCRLYIIEHHRQIERIPCTTRTSQPKIFVYILLIPFTKNG